MFVSEDIKFMRWDRNGVGVVRLVEPVRHVSGQAR